MALQSHHRSKSDRKRRAAHFALKKSTTIACSNCKKEILPHHLCTHCGQYKGRQVVTTKIKKAKQ